MHIINHEQGSVSWLRWRSLRITATDASVLMGLNPFKSMQMLWEEKLGIAPPPRLNEKMKRGQELEPIARDLFIQETGIKIVPICCEHDKEWWMAASLDGLSECGKIACEIKCPKLDTHITAVKEKEIPKYYYAQCQHQLFVSNADKVIYTSYHPDYKEELAFIEILPDVEFIEKLRERSQFFYDHNLCQMKPPVSQCC